MCVYMYLCVYVQVFTHDSNGQLRKAQQYLWYQTSSARDAFGAVCWSDSIKDRTARADKQIELQKVTDVYVGKQYAPVFSHPLTQSVDERRALSLVAGSRQVSIEFDSVQTLTVYISGISNILNTAGMTVQLESEEAAPSSSASSGAAAAGTRRRYSVNPGAYVKPAALPETAHETVKQLAARRQTLMQLSDRDTVDMMRAGSRFFRYYQKSAGGPASKEQVIVFYSDQDRSFYWCMPMGPKQQLPSQCVRLTDLTDVWLGMHARIHTRTECCCTAGIESVSLTSTCMCVYLCVCVHQCVCINLCLPPYRQADPCIIGPRC